MFGSSRYEHLSDDDPSSFWQKLAAPETFLRFPSTVISQSELGPRLICQLTARFWSTQKRSRSICFSILPEPLFGSSVSDTGSAEGCSNASNTIVKLSESRARCA